MTKFAGLAAFVLSSLVVATPAFAMKGIDAARQCEARPDCHVTYRDDGSIFIDAAGGSVECEGPQRECIVLSSKGVRGIWKGDVAALIAPQADNALATKTIEKKTPPATVAPPPSTASGPDGGGKPSSNNGLGGGIKTSPTGPMAPSP